MPIFMTTDIDGRHQSSDAYCLGVDLRDVRRVLERTDKAAQGSSSVLTVEQEIAPEETRASSFGRSTGLPEELGANWPDFVRVDVIICMS